MSVAAPKHQANEPIDLDMIIVCRKREAILGNVPRLATLIDDAVREAAGQVARLNSSGRSLSRNDVRVILMAQIIRRLSWQPSLTESLRYLDSRDTSIEGAIDRLHQRQQIAKRAPRTQTNQITLW